MAARGSPHSAEALIERGEQCESVPFCDLTSAIGDEFPSGAGYVVLTGAG